MTTIFWNGKILAGDSRRTQGKSHSDNALKIVRVENCVFKGEKVILMAAAGTVSVIDGFYELFTKDPDNYKASYKAVVATGLPYRHNPSGATVLVITEESSYTIRIYSTGVVVQERITFPHRDGNNFVTLGSGAPSARMMVRLFDTPPILAVALAGISEARSGTGGTINYVNVDKGKIVSEGAKMYNSTQEIYAEAIEHISLNAKYLGEHQSLITRTVRGPKKDEPTAPCVSPDAVVVLASGKQCKVKDLKVGDELKTTIGKPKTSKIKLKPAKKLTSIRKK